MIESKGWQWTALSNQGKEIWRFPSQEAYYLCARWTGQNKKSLLDLGCGMGRHSIFFGRNGFDVSCLDISEEAISSTREWAESEKLEFDYKIGDMLKLPYEDAAFDCIMCRNVISHADTEGVKQAISEIFRVLKPAGECFLTIASKADKGFKHDDWPLIDENTRVRMEEGPEYGIPHFYADRTQVTELLSDFETVSLMHIEDYYWRGDAQLAACHYHVLIRKPE